MLIAFQIVRLIAVIALLCFAAALATPPGRLPLALRGIRKILRKDMGTTGEDQLSQEATKKRRILAFILVLLAVALVVFV